MRWEYSVASFWDGKVHMAGGKEQKMGEEEYLNQMGADGWELVTVQGDRISVSVYFKRPKP